MELLGFLCHLLPFSVLCIQTPRKGTRGGPSESHHSRFCGLANMIPDTGADLFNYDHITKIIFWIILKKRCALSTKDSIRHHLRAPAVTEAVRDPGRGVGAALVKVGPKGDERMLQTKLSSNLHTICGETCFKWRMTCKTLTICLLFWGFQHCLSRKSYKAAIVHRSTVW